MSRLFLLIFLLFPVLLFVKELKVNVLAYHLGGPDRVGFIVVRLFDMDLAFDVTMSMTEAYGLIDLAARRKPLNAASERPAALGADYRSNDPVGEHIFTVIESAGDEFHIIRIADRVFLLAAARHMEGVHGEILPDHSVIDRLKDPGGIQGIVQSMMKMSLLRNVQILRGI